ncbi:MAG: type II secretion system F family protein [Gemmatimonadaceae bacterium]|nr:type II secretion system F family protein [Gemmatimonadaceae bacterium]
MTSVGVQEPPRYRYRAATTDGGMVEGVLQAASREQAVEHLRRQQLVPVTVDLTTPDASSGRGLGLLRGGSRRDLALWTRTLATLLAAGAPMDRALAVARTQVSHPGVAAAADDIRRRVVAGTSVGDAMRAHPEVFAPMHAAMIDAGEATGALDRACELLADYLDEDSAWREQLQTALLYPVLMSLVATLGTLVLLLVVVPRFSSLLSDLGGTLPLSTRVLVAVGTAVAQWWWLLLVGAVLVVAGGSAWLSTPAVRAALHAKRLSWPVIGDFERALATARFTRGLGVLLDGGLPLLSAWRLAQGGVTNVAIAAGLRRAADDVGRGVPVATATSSVLSPLASQLLAIGEESGQLAALALRAAATHERAVQRTLRVATGLIEPTLIVVFGGIVGLVALAMLQAIYAVNAGLT